MFNSGLRFKLFNFYTCIIIGAILNGVVVNSRQHPDPLPRKQRAIPNPAFQANWNDLGQEAIRRALNVQLNTNVAKNVILFLGDGMGISTITAGRIYAGQLRGEVGESYELSFDKFPHVALSKTYNVDFQVPDSAGTATAFLCGEKANMGVIGVNQQVMRSDCSTMAEENNITSIVRWSLDKGKRTGVVTSTKVTHATPASSYAHAPERNWESDRDVPEADRYKPLCEDIASQLITKNFDINIVLGGGRTKFLPNTEPDLEYPERNGSRLDDRNLIEEWQDKMAELGRSHAFVWNRDEFQEVDTQSADYVLGLFDEEHMKYRIERAGDRAGEPTLVEMTEFAINSLSRSESGYFLLVEGGRIDTAHHDNWAKASLTELAEFDEAVQKALDLTSEEDTLIVVTADHSHVFTMGGYSYRNTSIIDFVHGDEMQNLLALDNMTYVTLMYANGPNGVHGRANLSEQDPTHDDFRQPSQVPLNSESHAGEDVAIFARGPMSHLFHGVQEQSYIAHAMAYASCVGRNQEHCTNVNASSRSYFQISYLFILLALVYLV